MSAQLTWPAGQRDQTRTVAAARLVAELAPAARQGLVQAGVAADEADGLLGVICARAATGQTGAAWQRATLAAAGQRHDRKRASRHARPLPPVLSDRPARPHLAYHKLNPRLPGAGRTGSPGLITAGQDRHPDLPRYGRLRPRTETRRVPPSHLRQRQLRAPDPSSMTAPGTWASPRGALRTPDRKQAPRPAARGQPGTAHRRLSGDAHCSGQIMTGAGAVSLAT